VSRETDCSCDEKQKCDDGIKSPLVHQRILYPNWKSTLNIAVANRPIALPEHKSDHRKQAVKQELHMLIIFDWGSVHLSMSYHKIVADACEKAGVVLQDFSKMWFSGTPVQNPFRAL
jgi:hypothetical protein